MLVPTLKTLLIGELTLPELPISKTRDNVDLVGLSPPVIPLKDKTVVPVVPNNNSLIAIPLTMVATVDL